MRLRPPPASMGPQPFGCGRRRKGPLGSQYHSRFNGAATFRLRKVLTQFRCKDLSYQLQWGRNLSVAEGSRPAALFLFHPTRFNGAATFRLRKAELGHQVVDDPAASMGPQPFGCGRRITARPSPPVPHASMGPQPFGCGRAVRSIWRPSGLRLQWGRNLSVAEGPVVARGGHLPDASMGPQPFGCGRTTTTKKKSRPRSASMGPQPFGCGRLGIGRRGPRRGDQLQWGRNLSVAEGQCAPLNTAIAHRFNGAATFRLRKDPPGRGFFAN